MDQNSELFNEVNSGQPEVKVTIQNKSFQGSVDALYSSYHKKLINFLSIGNFIRHIDGLYYHLKTPHTGINIKELMDLIRNAELSSELEAQIQSFSERLKKPRLRSKPSEEWLKFMMNL